MLPSSSSPVPFHTTVRTESAYELKTEAARRNDHIKTPYKAPSDYCHRPESPATTWSTPGTDFLAKFCLPDTQELRRRIALDQEGFFTDGSPSSPVKLTAATSLVKSDQPGVRIKSSTRPGSPTQAFESRVPHTSRKSANTSLRLEKIVDQDGLLPQLHDIRQH
ncbi:hypothetical protein Poli38472_014795 [Pythium oligandrum]|uniref:Uncharacterized protein n=1 Tax=Pythium oligandrum TaxID=41045 RepID=A0A8K1FHG6_PYTOL|nr:hypothetical protein Poli38472_014795 [Pythium oligandrum]|eukprot:TMW63885.1 hypothetical protein Poli38472_014795 [Pythium oligandrum]